MGLRKRVFLAACAIMIAIPLTLSACGGAGNGGEALTKDKCGGCHSYDRITENKKSREEWDSTITRMEGLGLSITSDERAQVLDHLSSL